MTPPTTTPERSPAEHEPARLCAHTRPMIRRLLLRSSEPLRCSVSYRARSLSGHCMPAKLKRPCFGRAAAFRGGLPWLRRLAWGGGALATVASQLRLWLGSSLSRSQHGAKAPPALAFALRISVRCDSRRVRPAC